MSYYCPYCGMASQLLFNLVTCVTEGCRNYDATWAREWYSNNKYNYYHDVEIGHSHVFLGNYVSVNGVVFDLYTCKSHKNETLCVARYGNSNSECYYVDDKETEIGNFSKGKVDTISSCIKDALQEALRRHRKK